MGGLIGRHKLADQSLSAVKRMETLAAVAQTISAESYLERILQAISEMVAETLDSAVCSILLVDEEKKELTVSAARCSSPDYYASHADSHGRFSLIEGRDSRRDNRSSSAISTPRSSSAIPNSRGSQAWHRVWRRRCCRWVK